MNSLQKHDKALLKACDWLIGVDEAGRGALAGPVVAGACVLSTHFFESKEAIKQSSLVNDSKQLKAEQRNKQLDTIIELQKKSLLDFEVGVASVSEIETLNILGATRLAMTRALDSLAKKNRDTWQLPSIDTSGPLFESFSPRVDVIVDGRPLKPFLYAHKGIVKGDGKSLSIAIASIAAKVTRDRIMQQLALQYSDYGFERHKGYGTASHRTAIQATGASPEHRKLFLRKILNPESTSPSKSK